MKKYYAEPGGDIKKELQKCCDSLQLMWLLDSQLVCQEAKKIETTDGDPYQLAKEGSPAQDRTSAEGRGQAEEPLVLWGSGLGV